MHEASLMCTDPILLFAIRAEATKKIYNVYFSSNVYFFPKYIANL